MVKALIIILFLILGSVGGYFVYKYFSPSEVPNKKTLANYNEPFMWGVSMRASALGNYNPETWVKQIKLAKELGVSWIRISWDYENADPFKRNDEVIKFLNDYGLNALMIIEQDPKKQGKVDNYKDGFDDGYKISSHYKGKIKFYQMINEGGAQTIKEPTWNGQTEDQYDEAKYIPTRDYLKGLSEGIAKGDPDAWRVVSISYTHTGYLDKIVKDSVSFDVLGLDWYDWMGPIGEKKLDSGQMFSDKLKSYGKPMIFMEVNAVPQAAKKNSQSKTLVDEEEQASFIGETAKWAWEHQDFVKGFYVHELIDNINNPNENYEYYGIISAKKSASGVGSPSDYRQAFYTYQDLIKQSLGQ